MNERIRELAVEAKIIHPNYANIDGDRVPPELNKFAELLIRECANIDFRSKVGMTTDQEFETGCVILEHFEVEE